MTDRLETTHFLDELTGKVYMYQSKAMQDLDGECTASAFLVGVKTTLPGSKPCRSQKLACLDFVKGACRRTFSLSRIDLAEPVKQGGTICDNVSQ